MKTKLKYTIILLLCCAPGLWAQQEVQAPQKIVDMTVAGNEKFSESEYLDWSGIQRNSRFFPKKIKTAGKNIISQLLSRGYLLARIDSVSVIAKSAGEISLVWHVREDKPFLLGDVTIISDSLDQETIQERLDLTDGMVYDESLIEDELKVIGRVHSENGFPFASVSIGGPGLRKEDPEYRVDLNLNISAGRRLLVDQININGNSYTRDRVILRELDIAEGDIFNQAEIDQIPARLNRLGYFKRVETPRIMMQKRGKSTLLIEVEEGNTSTFDGIIGYVPPSTNNRDQDGFFTGLIQLSFRNLFGTGREFEVYWKKPDRFSDEFRIYYEEPWVFDYPLNVGLGIERIVRDTTYIERSLFASGSVRITSNFKGTFAFRSRSTIPDSAASRDRRLTDNSLINGEIGLVYDTRDYPLNPRSGIVYSTVFSFGFKKNNGPIYLLQEDNIAASEEIQSVQVGFSYFQGLFTNQVLSLNFFGGSIKSNKERLQLTDHFWFGGARSLRGYRENQFHGATVSWINLEYRFLLGRDARIFLFNDWGFYNYKEANKTREDILPGYGLGLRFSSPLGIMSVDFGLGRGDTFSTGKIHFGLINSF